MAGIDSLAAPLGFSSSRRDFVAELLFLSPSITDAVSYNHVVDMTTGRLDFHHDKHSRLPISRKGSLVPSRIAGMRFEPRY